MIWKKQEIKQLWQKKNKTTIIAEKHKYTNQKSKTQ
jgi:hypothetical protein